MNVLIDTPIWSLAFRRKRRNLQEDALVSEFDNLISEFRASIIGPIRQEILSGITNRTQFNLLKKRLEAFKDLAITTRDYETASEFYNKCRGEGIQGSHIDFIICAVSFRNKISVFTTDEDFQLYSNHIDIKLYTPKNAG